jgi:hypothetical protein
MHDIEHGKGAVPDLADRRDRHVRDLIAAGAVAPVTDADWKKGFSVYELLGIQPGKRDQGARSTCVCETCAEYARVLRRKVTGEDVTFSATSAYPFIVILPNGGAYLRDGAKALVDGRFAPKSVLPDEDASGNPLPEDVARDKARVTAAVTEAAKKLDVYDSYYSMDGKTDDINVFAAAIRAGMGAILGFTGTNAGWCSCPVIRPPKPGEPKWGHAVFSGEFGETDVAECGIPVGTRAVFVPGSWGGRYTFTSGRWKGRSAITAEYFLASEDTAVGPVSGIHVFPSWTVIPSAIVPPGQFTRDFTKQHDRKLGRCPEDGSRFLVLGADPQHPDGRVLRIREARAGFAALACIDYGIDQTRRVDIPKATVDKLIVTDF